MKKYILSFLVAGTFGLYALYSRFSTADSLTSAPIPAPQETPITSVTPSPSPSSISPPPAKNSGQYIDGTYNGVSADSYYGNVQVAAVIKGGKLADVQVLDYPHDRPTSIRINQDAMPQLRSEAIKIQSAQVHIVSGATDSSGAFRQSLASALDQAKNK